MIDSVFVSMSDTKMASLIDQAERRVCVALPALRQRSATALNDAILRLGANNVAAIMDCDEEVFRLGYGEITALSNLQEAGCSVRQSSGLRIGVLVCDDRAWVFAPTALFLQAEIQSDETPNAVPLQKADIGRIVARMLPATADEQPHRLREPEIGHDEIPRSIVIERPKPATSGRLKTSHS